MKLKLLEDTQNTYHVYHGSRKQFNKFEYQFIGSHGLENGFGIYFTNKLDIAHSYGDYILECDITINKKFSDSIITITKDQVKEYIKKYIDSDGYDYLSNWYDVNDYGYKLTLDLVVDKLFTYNQCDNDIISELLPEVKNKWSDEAYDAIFKIFHKDGIIYKGYSEWDGEEITNYIIYSNNQISNKKWININKEEI